MKGGHNMKYNKDEILKFFEEAGYDNVEIVGNRLLFTTGEDIYNFSIQEAINFMKG
jgi:sugar phosphate isomerase/epimerase